MRALVFVGLLLTLSGCTQTTESAAYASNDPNDVDGVPHANLYMQSADSGCGAAGQVSCRENQYGVTFTNLDGDWVVYKDCWGPKKRGGDDLSVGPGYIARVVLSRPTPDGNRTIVDDEQGPGTVHGVLNAAGYGGLGAFGWHHSRGHAPYDFDWNDAWNMDGRHCAEDNGGFGVSGAKVIEGPGVDANGVGFLSVDVFFTDGYTQSTPLMRVRYRYRFHSDVVKVWAVATEQCDHGNCGTNTPGPAFIKEPKFVGAVSGGGYQRMVVLNDQGDIAGNSFGSSQSCAWRGTNPKVSTGQCDADRRARARFDFRSTLPSSASDNGGACDAANHPCFDLVMRAYPATPDGDVKIGGATSSWEKSGLGLDAWAVAAETRQAVNATDSPGGGATWACHGGQPSDEHQRRWELAGGAKNAKGQYLRASFFFHGWEGGTGGYDCEPLSRRFGPAGESFAIHAEYAVNSGWALE